MKIGAKENYIFRPDSVYTLSAEETNQIVGEILSVIAWGGLEAEAENTAQMAEALSAMLYTKTEVDEIQAALQAALDGINAKIPVAASASNQLADKQYVDELFCGTAKYMGDIRFGADNASRMQNIPAEKLAEGDLCFVAENNCVYRWDGTAWEAEPPQAVLAGQYYNIVFWYGQWDGKMYGGEVSAMVTCFDSAGKWNLIVYTDELTPGEATDEAIGPRTLKEGDACAALPIVGPATLTEHLQALRDYVKFLGENKQNQLVVGAGLHVDETDPLRPVLSVDSVNGIDTRCIGEVYWSQSRSLADNPGSLPLWTGAYYANGSVLYPVFYNWLKEKHPELCKTKAEYDEALETYGECPFYVLDETEGSLRLPKLAHFIKNADESGGVTQSGAGLPNITGTVPTASWAVAPTGVFERVSTGEQDGDNSGRNGWIMSFDASRSSALYGASDTVTPAHTTLYPWVHAYQTAVPDSSQQVAEILEAGDEQTARVQAEGEALCSQINEAGVLYVEQARLFAQSARGLCLGTVYFSQSALAQNNPGALPLFTGETIASAADLYPDFYKFVSADPGLQCSAEEYEAAVLKYGECPKYVLSDGALRLPLLKNYVKMANLEDGITQGAKPDGWGVPDYTAGYTIPSGTTLTEDALVTCTGSPGGYSTINMSINGQKVYQGGVSENSARPRAGNIYAAKGQTVTSEAGTLTAYPLRSTQMNGYATLFPWVYAFNSAVEAGVAQAAQFQQALSGKADADLGNLPDRMDAVVDFYADENGNWYRQYKSGWVEQGGIAVKTGGQGSSSSVLFLKPFRNLAYSLEATPIYNAAGDVTVSVHVKKTDTAYGEVYFMWQSTDCGSSAQWTAKGFVSPEAGD